MNAIYSRFVELLLSSRYAVALTGAGLSVESGIPDFRSDEGVWAKYDPFEYGHIDSFRADPAKVWKLLEEMRALVESAGPNEAHYALGELERVGVLKAIITQNVDSLHQKGGASNVIEFHGSFRAMHCESCRKSYWSSEVSMAKLPPRCACGGPIRPDVVLFGEGIPESVYLRAFEAASRCDLMIVAGTSASVAPASDLPLVAKRGGASIVEINPNASDLPPELSDLRIIQTAGEAFTNIMKVFNSMHTEVKN
ncbi:MAG: SIR2 family NAD-dependent protein deacylase [Syntrophobacteraceae bacterium]